MATRSKPGPPALGPPGCGRFAGVTSSKHWYGWTVLAVASVALVATSPGQTYLVSLFNLPMRRELGLSATELSGAYMAATLGSASLMAFIGRSSDRVGPGRLMMLAAFGLGIATLWMSQVTSLWMLVVGFFGIRLCGQGALSLGSGHALAMWFERRLGVAEGIRLTVFGLGMASLPAATALSIERFGWRMTWPILGLGASSIVIGLVLSLHKNRPEDVGQTLDGDPAPSTTGDPGDPGGDVEPVWGFTLKEALRSPAFWAVVLASMNSAMIGTALLFHVQPLAVSAGMDESSAARLIGTFAVVSTSLFFVAGSLSDRVRPGFVFATVAALITGSCLVHAWAASAGALTLAWAMLGVGSALQMTTSSPTLARCFGRAHHGAIRGMLTTISVAGSAIGPLVLGLSEDLSGGFAPGLLGFAFWSLGVGVFALSVSIEPPRS